VHKLNAKYWYIVKGSDVDIGHTIREIARFLDFIHFFVLKKKRKAMNVCHPLSWGYEVDLFSITENTCVGYRFFL